MKLKGLMPTGDNPLGAPSSILGGLLGQKGKTAAGQQQQQQKQNSADEIMGLFRKKKKQPQ